MPRMPPARSNAPSNLVRRGLAVRPFAATKAEVSIWRNRGALGTLNVKTAFELGRTAAKSDGLKSAKVSDADIATILAFASLAKLFPPDVAVALRGLDTMTFESSSDPLQDFTYTYDPVGNLATIDERAANCGVADAEHGAARVVRFDYDSIRRTR